MRPPSICGMDAPRSTSGCLLRSGWWPLARVALRALRSSGSVDAVARTPSRGVDALAVALPILGLLVGDVGLSVLD